MEDLSDSLKSEYGSGFGRRNLFNMIRFAEVYQDHEIVQTLSAQLSWSHFIEIIYLKDPLQRQFYAEMARLERGSVRTLRQKIQGMLYERTAISRKPEELERFLLELGTDFSFIARQKRMTIGNKDFYLDLLFYHRSLRRLVAVELKLGSFDAAYKGQMELYLRWLDKYERRQGEESPVGLILCGEKNREQIELLQLDRGEIRVAEYLVELPPREMLEAKLHEAMRLARGQVGAKEKMQND